MNKSNSTVNLIMAIAFFIALAMVAVFGIPFLQIPALFQTEELDLSSDFRNGYEIVATVLADSDASENNEEAAGSAQAAAAVLPTLQKRASAVKYDVKVVDLKDGTISLRFPADAIADDPATLAKQLCVRGVLTIVDSEGETLIPGDAIAEVTPGYGSLSQNSTDMSYYISFRVKDEYIADLADATAQLALKADGTNTANSGNVMHIQLDGSDILIATVGESMTSGSFTIGGNFDDETMPVLYSALINYGAIDHAITLGEMQDFVAPLSADAFGYFWLGFAALIVLMTIVVCILFRALAVSYFATSAFYWFFSAFCFQIFGIRFSINSLIGLLIGWIALAVILINFYAKVKEELNTGKPARASIERGMKKASVLYLTLSLILLLLSTALWVLSALLGWSATDLAIISEASVTLFAASLFMLVFAYWSTSFWYKVLLGYGKNDPKIYGAGRKIQEQE